MELALEPLVEVTRLGAHILDDIVLAQVLDQRDARGHLRQAEQRAEALELLLRHLVLVEALVDERPIRRYGYGQGGEQQARADFGELLARDRLLLLLEQLVELVKHGHVEQVRLSFY